MAALALRAIFDWIALQQNGCLVSDFSCNSNKPAAPVGAHASPKIGAAAVSGALSDPTVHQGQPWTLKAHARRRDLFSRLSDLHGSGACIASLGINSSAREAFSRVPIWANSANGTSCRVSPVVAWSDKVGFRLHRRLFRTRLRSGSAL